MIDLGFGEKEKVISRVPEGRWVVIRDDDAATVGAGAWYAYQTDSAIEAEAAHEADGGTVSASYAVAC